MGAILRYRPNALGVTNHQPPATASHFRIGAAKLPVMLVVAEALGIGSNVSSAPKHDVGPIVEATKPEVDHKLAKTTIRVRLHNGACLTSLVCALRTAFCFDELLTGMSISHIDLPRLR